MALPLEGTAAIGKTTSWQAATERRYTTLACRAAQSEARLSLRALVDLLEELADDLPARLPAPQRQALEVALLTEAARLCAFPRGRTTTPSSANRSSLAVSPVVADNPPRVHARLPSCVHNP